MMVTTKFCLQQKFEMEVQAKHPMSWASELPVMVKYGKYQEKYRNQTLKRLHMKNCKTISTPTERDIFKQNLSS